MTKEKICKNWKLTVNFYVDSLQTRKMFHFIKCTESVQHFKLVVRCLFHTFANKLTQQFIGECVKDAYNLE